MQRESYLSPDFDLKDSPYSYVFDWFTMPECVRRMLLICLGLLELQQRNSQWVKSGAFSISNGLNCESFSLLA